MVGTDLKNAGRWRVVAEYAWRLYQFGLSVFRVRGISRQKNPARPGRL